jgi:putative intracellular protease/amidase
MKKHEENGFVLATISAVPFILNDTGLLNGYEYTAHLSAKLKDSIRTKSVMIDRNIITIKVTGTALEFGIVLVTKLSR